MFVCACIHVYFSVQLCMFVCAWLYVCILSKRVSEKPHVQYNLSLERHLSHLRTRPTYPPFSSGVPYDTFIQVAHIQSHNGTTHTTNVYRLHIVSTNTNNGLLLEPLATFMLMLFTVILPVTLTSAILQ